MPSLYLPLPSFRSTLYILSFLYIYLSLSLFLSLAISLSISSKRNAHLSLSSDHSEPVEFVETTEVEFAELNDIEIDAYVATQEPMDKAGMATFIYIRSIVSQAVDTAFHLRRFISLV